MSNKGKKVKVHYTGTLDNGDKFDSSYDHGEPLEFVCMQGQMIPGFDAAVDEMAVGDKKTVKIPSADAYGERSDDMLMVVPLDQIPNAEQLPAGERIMLTGPDGRPIPALVSEITDTTATFDLNHELAGQDLTFEIELLEAE